MPSFIREVLDDLIKQQANLTQLKFILPSKRAGLFLKNEIANLSSQTIFAPQILSIEEFVEELSQLQKISNTELLFEFYSVYLETASNKIESESFDSFLKWAQVLIQDFNEIDRYLVNPNNIFEYLKAIQDINHWSLEKNQTSLIKDYLSFWKKLPIFYNKLSERLINKGAGYQGLIYREAVENLESYIQFNESKTHIFIGFNALNTSESTIIKELLHHGMAQIYWDIDDSFITNPIHDAGHFIRSHKSQWSYFDANPFKWSHKIYQLPKSIQVSGIPKNVGQVKHVGDLLSQIKDQQGHLNSVAVVLGDESLLTPLLNSLPNNVETLNVTMGFPLRSVALASIFDLLFTVHKKGGNTYYFRDVVSILSHQFIYPLFNSADGNYADKIIISIAEKNLVHLTLNKLKSIASEKQELLDIIFGNWNNKPALALKNCKALIYKSKHTLESSKKENLLALEYLFRFNEIFNVLTSLHSKYQHIDSIESLASLYNEVLRNESLDFKGEPLEELQIMGMLESRVLDFETVIITSVNEGILPAGKSHNSFIPYDVKQEYGLPTYKEKDAVYTYHFYRLLQRAKNVHIIYNTEPAVLKGGEKSRFIIQLEIEGIHNISHELVIPKTPKIIESLQKIKKTPAVIEKLKTVAQKGFSPSSLTNYIRNPIDFYYQKVLGVYERDEVEETIAANTLGSVVHNTLEDLYKPLEGRSLQEVNIKKMYKQVEGVVSEQFKSIYKDGEITKGKNLIIFETAKRYVFNFLKMEETNLKNGIEIKIIKVEEELDCTIEVEGLDVPVKLTGKVDRIDMCNGVLRIIDYKTGKVDQPKVEIVDWENLTSDYDKYSKSFQVLMYAYMMHLNGSLKGGHAEAGIVSFKNLKKGFLKFSKKDKPGKGAKKTSLITQDTLSGFQSQLNNLLLEIFDAKTHFIEKDIT